MSFGGFGKNSGPNTQPGAQTPFGNSPRHPVPSSPLPVSPRPRGTGHYDKFCEEGVYNCGGCATPLYKSIAKFDSGCGWPAFFEGLPGAITRSRTEITCTACGGHLGHVFKWEGHSVPKDERYCVNSVSIKFVPVEAPAPPS